MTKAVALRAVCRLALAAAASTALAGPALGQAAAVDGRAAFERMKTSPGRGRGRPGTASPGRPRP